MTRNALTKYYVLNDELNVFIFRDAKFFEQGLNAAEKLRYAR